MKKYIILLILSISLHFISCDKSSNLNKQTELMDSIDNCYAKKIDTLINDSLKVYYIQEGLKLTKKIETDSTRLRYYYQGIGKMEHLINRDVRIKMLDTLLKQSIRFNDTLSMSRSYFGIGLSYSNDFPDSSYFYLDKAKELLSKKGLIEKQVRLEINRINILYNSRNFVRCEILIYNLLPILIKNKNYYDCYILYKLLSNVNVEKNDFIKADLFIKKAEELIVNFENRIDEFNADIAMDKGFMYLRSKNYEKSIYYSNITLKFCNSFQRYQTNTISTLKHNLYYAQMKMGNYKDVEKEFLKILEYNSKSFKKISEIAILTDLSEYYFLTKDLNKAKIYVERALQATYENNNLRDRLFVFEQLANIYPDKAAYYFKKHIELNDSISIMERDFNSQILLLENKTYNLNTENELLEEHNKQIIYYTLIGILLFALGFVYYWQKQKQKQLLFENNQQKNNEQIYQLMLDQQVKYEEGRTIEKRRIAKELHDGVMNKLAAVRFNLYALKRDRTDKTIEHCLTHVDEIQTIEKEIRTLSHDLSKEIFENSSNFEAIIQAIYWNNDEDATNISYHFDPKIKWETISAEAKLNCYRIIQESIINCLKYAQAKNCSVSITLEDTIFVIKISDDGIGFDPQKVKSGIGLKNIAERVALLKGKFKILATPNQGTTLFINVPINNITV